MKSSSSSPSSPWPHLASRASEKNFASHYDDREYEIEYSDFEATEEHWGTPRICARVIDLYFGYYFQYYALPKRYTDDDIQWSQVRFVLISLPPQSPLRTCLNRAISIGDPPFLGLYQYKYPEFGLTEAKQEKSGRFPHLKAMIYNDLNGTDDQLHRGELLIAMRMMMAQLKRAQFLDHMVVPVSLHLSTRLPSSDLIRVL